MKETEPKRTKRPNSLEKLREAAAKIPELPHVANQADRDAVLRAVVKALKEGF